MRIALCFIFLLITTGSFSKEKPLSEKEKIQEDYKKYSAKVDSLNRLYKSNYNTYSWKLDSAFNEKYQKQLERALAVDSAKDTYYGTVFSGIAIFVTVLIIFIGYNVYGSRVETERQVRAIADEARTSLATQQAAFNDAFASINAKAEEYELKNQKFIEEFEKDANATLDKIKADGATLTSDEELARIENLVKGLQIVVNTALEKKTDLPEPGKYTNIPKQELIDYINCKSCGNAMWISPLRGLDKLSFIKRNEKVKCTRCGAFNDRPSPMIPPNYA